MSSSSVVRSRVGNRLQRRALIPQRRKGKAEMRIRPALGGLRCKCPGSDSVC